jgi:hypothetical protein
VDSRANLDGFDGARKAGGFIMAWFLRGSLAGGAGSIRLERFEWQHDALHRAAELFDQYGSRVRLELALTEDGVPIRDNQWMSTWNRTGRQLPPKT